MPAQTQRQIIADILRAGPLTVPEIARKAGSTVKRVLDDLAHVRRSVRGDEKWAVEAAACAECGFVFRERQRLDAPSRCPDCRSEHLREARFEIQQR